MNGVVGMRCAGRLLKRFGFGCSLGAVALAGVGGTARVAGAADPSPPILAGPRVEPAAKAVTLVQTDYNGKVRRLETTPEEAAVALLILEAADRERVDEILRTRAQVLDNLVADNLLLFNRIDTASKSGRKFDTLLSVMELYGRFQPLRDCGVLHDEIESSLPGPARAEFDRLVSAYWDAIVEEGLRETKADGAKPGRVEVVLKERFEIFGREIERSFKRYEKTAVEDVMDRLLRGLNLSADQVARTQPIVDRLAQAIRADAPEKERGVLVVELMAFLTSDQQAKLVEAFRKLGR